MRTIVVHGGRPLRGTVRVPGDKSISHRAALLGALASGETRITGFLRSEDCFATLRCLRRLGASVEDNGDVIVVAAPTGGRFVEPDAPLDVGNAGTLMRLLAGTVAAQPIRVTLDGDASIRRRPMDRIAAPLRLMGARVTGKGERVLPPIAIEGADLTPVHYTSPVASAQVKSCVLLAGCQTRGITSVTEPALSRDHTERMLAAFGASVSRDGLTVAVEGPARLEGRHVTVPGDISSAAFYLAAGALVPGSEVLVERAGVNPTRTGFLDILAEMGAPVRVIGPTESSGEPVADLGAATQPLSGVEVSGDVVPRAIDELPLVALCGCFASGPTEIRDAAELRVKESDRVSSVAEALTALGGRVEPRPDGLIVTPSPLRPGTVESRGDHRIAMMAVVAGLALGGATTVRDGACIETSFPGFVSGLQALGADVEECEG